MTAVSLLYPIVAVILLDNRTGSRILAKYYGTEYPGNTTADSILSTTKQQLAFEGQLYERTRRYPDSKYHIIHINDDIGKDEVAMLENGFITVYRSNLDVTFYLIGTASQNELLLGTVLDAYFEVLSDGIK